MPVNDTTLTLPRPALVLPGFAELPDAIQAAIEDLSKPFPIEEVNVRPGPITRDGTAAIALPYGEWWTGYLPRLNDRIGPNSWRIQLQPWGEHQIIARLSAFGGLIEKESSGSAKGDTNGAQEAEAQAKKRVCAEGLMLGLFFYFLPTVWGKGERVGKEFCFAQGEQERCVYEMYRRAGLLPSRSAGASLPTTTSTSPAHAAPRPAAAPSSAWPAAPAPALPARPTPPAPAAPSTARVAIARTALDQAEQRVGLTSRAAILPATRDDERPQPILASDAQLGLIARLITEARSADPDALTALGTRFKIANLAELRTREELRTHAAALTKFNAMKLIDALKALDRTSLSSAA